MLVWLNKVEVTTLASRESVVSIKLNLSINYGINARCVSESRPVIGSFTSLSVDNPVKSLTWVVEGELALNSRVTERFSTLELKLLN